MGSELESAKASSFPARATGWSAQFVAARSGSRPLGYGRNAAARSAGPGGRRAAAGEVGGHPEPYDSGRSPAPPRLLRGPAREGSFRAETPLPPPTGRRWGEGALELTATCLTSCGHSLRARGSCCETPSRSRGVLGLWPLLMGDALVVREALGPRTHSSPSSPSGRGDPDGVPSL